MNGYQGKGERRISDRGKMDKTVSLKVEWNRNDKFSFEDIQLEVPMEPLVEITSKWLNI